MYDSAVVVGPGTRSPVTHVRGEEPPLCQISIGSCFLTSKR